MNEPIVNPWVFYLIEIIHNLDIVVNLLAGICIIEMLVCFTIWQNKEASYYYKGDNLKAKRWLRIFVVATGVLLVPIILIPSNATMNKMLVASYVTQNNINTAIGASKDLAEYISDLIVTTANKIEKK